MQDISELGRKMAALDVLAANFNGEMPENLKKVWLGLFAEYPAEVVEQAVIAVIEAYEFKTLPPFAVLKRHLADLAGVSDKALELQALAEWDVMQAAVRKYGSNRTPDLHETTSYAVRLMGGWGQVCAWEIAYLDIKRRDFVQLWKELHGREAAMQLGANGVKAALAQGGRREPVAIGQALKNLSLQPAHEVRQ